MESHRINKGTNAHDEIVLIDGDEKNHGEWKKGRVVKLLRGKDGVIRGVQLLHKGCHIERPLSLVCPLEIQAAIADTQPQAVEVQQPRRSNRQAAKNAKEVIRTLIEEEDLNC